MGRGGGGGGGGGSCDDDHHLHLRSMSEDVLIQILLCLPVISLLRFKSVCKSWRSIIESPFFIHLHATTTTTTEEDSVIFIGFHPDEVQEANKGKIFKVSGVEVEDLGRPPLLDLGEMTDWVKEWEVFSVVGCCNGIICLHDYFTRNVALWNPATKQSRVVPKPSNPLGNPNWFNVQQGVWVEDFVRFGVDIKTNDYKLLLITSITRFTTNDPPSAFSDESPDERRVHVYSLSTHSWRCIDATLSADHLDPPDISIERLNSQGLYLNGSYFFRATYFNESIKERSPLLLSFDFTGEIFRTIQPPSDLKDTYISGYTYFIYFGDKVALVDAKQEEFHDCVEYDIWVLNEQHRVKEPWTKFYTIASPDWPPNEPLCITNNGEFAIIHGPDWEKDRQQNAWKLELLNLITGEKKILRWDYDNSSRVHVYKPSLVPTGGNGATHNNRLLELDAFGVLSFDLPS